MNEKKYELWNKGLLERNLQKKHFKKFFGKLKSSMELEENLHIKNENVHFD